MHPDKASVLTINGGSSSIKFAVFDVSRSPLLILSGKLEGLGRESARLTIKISGEDTVSAGAVEAPDYASAVSVLMGWLQKQVNLDALIAIGHRIVHGGPDHAQPELITAALLSRLRALQPLDPEHLPGEIQLIEAFQKALPRLKQIACFDTEFHRDMPKLAKMLAIPRHYFETGVWRYGFHGLSYRYLMQALHQQAGETAAMGKVILAHLGNGASMAAVREGKCVDTSMGLTPAAGLVMGTRSGDIDPGLCSLLARTENMTATQFDYMINHQSGLLGLSETSSDMQELLAKSTKDQRAADAVALFCYQARKQVGAYAAVLGGLDSLIFSGGIGENAAAVRLRICEGLEFLGITLDETKNLANAAVISTSQSRVQVRVIPTDEESMIAQFVCDVLNQKDNGDKQADD